MFLKKKTNKTYYIHLDNDDWVAPEETLLDSNSQYSDIEKPISGSVFRFFIILFSLVSLTLAIFTFKISIIEHGQFAKLAFQNRSANFALTPPRGLILDRNGHGLVMNVPVFNLLALTRELKENGQIGEKNIAKIGEVLGLDQGEFIEDIKDQARNSSAFIAYRELTKDQAVQIEYLNFPGFYIVPDMRREYAEGSKFSQIIGYTGKVSKDDLASDDYYFPTDSIGKLGIESHYEKYIRGSHGSIFFSNDQANHVTKESQPGKNIVLNIDRDLQAKFHDEILKVLKESGLSRGAGIIQNPKTGAVLALVSFPDFDNNIFTSKISEQNYRFLFENRTKPLLNRVTSGLYNPGSTIKPLVGMAALKEKIISPQDTINDCIGIVITNPYNKEVAYTFNNWRIEHGPFNLKRAIANSCNVYFFTIGGGYEKIKGLGAEKLAKYFKSSLADSVLGIDLPGEINGFVPDPVWKLKEKGEPWYLGDTYNISIGQGDMLVTPLWLNSYISAIANGGTIYKPKVTKAIVENDGTFIEEYKPEIAGSLPFNREIINEMQMAMRETVLSGTAKIFKDFPVEIAAKTGTAEVQKGKSVNSLFTMFAPSQDPDFTMTILIEGATTQQGLAIRAAHGLLKWYFNKN